jgi:hypothetical protein
MDEIELGRYSGTALLSVWAMIVIAAGVATAAWLLWRWLRP